MSLIIPLVAALALVPAPAKRSSYVVTVTTESGQESRATLKCRPTGGTHPHKKKACVQLITAGGDIAAIPPVDGLCTTEYAPVTLRAKGTWDGTRYEYENVFGNRCVGNLQTGGRVFNLTF